MTTNDKEWQQVTTNDNDWHRVIASGTTGENKWQGVTTSATMSDKEWQRVIKRVTMSDNKWQWMTESDSSSTTNENGTVHFKEWMIAILSITKTDTLLLQGMDGCN